ncbi:MAG TPA: N-acetyltransferase [Pelagibacterium sp.]|uniref:GNAT family N-acetyltransferase n=1 Tax=Pelagibacterium sp. TaxID=1967288 RepID=UPI002BFF90D3|nr:N-acetyltransferase [Pelagibacterium sp.]HWJ88589.1 N-acetyltransferase [Pelagibacterium sp.]
MTATSPLLADTLPTPALLSIRLETPEDDSWIEALHEVSFGPGRFARAAYRVREQIGVDPKLSHIAQIGAERAASVRMTPIAVGGINGYLLGPLMTDPQFRKRGAGRALVAHVCDMALEQDGVEFVLLVGDFAYYAPLGFVRVAPNAITFPGPVDPARVLVHSRDPDMGDRLAGDVRPWA